MRLLVLTAALVAGCASDACVVGSVKCDGATAWTCAQGGGLGGSAWSKSECKVTCQLIADLATCVDSAEPVDDCATDGPACWNGAPTTCVGGFPTWTEAACKNGATCVSFGGCAAVCAYPDPAQLCQGKVMTTSVCDGNDAVTCACTVIIDRTPCDPGTTCTVDDNYVECE